jgi:uncharacterized protein with HEPN domain
MSTIPEADAIRLRHMLDAAVKARLFVRNRDRGNLEADEMLALALVRLLEILGKPRLVSRRKFNPSFRISLGAR